MVEIRSKKRGGRSFYGCATYPQCDFKLWQKPVKEPCPECQHPFLVVGGGAKNPKLICPRGKECGYSRAIEGDENLDGQSASPSGAGTEARLARPEDARARGGEAPPPF
jgi:DNA topoisomerase-1